MPRAYPTGRELTPDIDLFKLCNKWSLIPVGAVILIRAKEVMTRAVV
jgi:hypothetical protein